MSNEQTTNDAAERAAAIRAQALTWFTWKATYDYTQLLHGLIGDDSMLDAYRRWLGVPENSAAYIALRKEMERIRAKATARSKFYAPETTGQV